MDKAVIVSVFLTLLVGAIFGWIDLIETEGWFRRKG
jgi:hypothetical protein